MRPMLSAVVRIATVDRALVDSIHAVSLVSHWSHLTCICTAVLTTGLFAVPLFGSVRLGSEEQKKPRKVYLSDSWTGPDRTVLTVGTTYPWGVQDLPCDSPPEQAHQAERLARQQPHAVCGEGARERRCIDTTPLSRVGCGDRHTKRDALEADAVVLYLVVKSATTKQQDQPSSDCPTPTTFLQRGDTR